MAIYKKKLGGMQACCNERPNGKYLWYDLIRLVLLWPDGMATKSNAAIDRAEVWTNSCVCGSIPNITKGFCEIKNLVTYSLILVVFPINVIFEEESLKRSPGK
jgi:hypothetical protein